ncbi:MAG: NADPH-dependent glutamate synthase [Candidatus Bipolaricaulota bacterium]
MDIKEDHVPMKEQDPDERRKNFKEVPLGYSKEEAIEEASRCLQCDPAPCITGCPVEINIPKFIRHIREEDFQEAIDTIKETNNLPAVTGRVCPQEEQCQEKCVMGRKWDPISIGRLERFAAEWERDQGKETPKVEASKEGKVAIVGSGPSGLTAASDLKKLGYDVTVFEQFHQSGGVLVYGIPEFRLPNDIVDGEVEALESMGVDIQRNTVVGRLFTVDDLLEGNKVDEYDAVFLGTGAGLPWFLGLPGENLNGVYSANEFLTRVNLMKAFKFPEYDTPVKVGKRVATIGGGNVAMDSARTALRLGAEKSMIVYRRSEDQMPARDEEIEHAKQEGIEFHLLRNPRRFIGEDGNVKKVEVVKMELGEPDSSGRPRPIPIEGSEYVIDADDVIMAIGTSPHPLVPRTTSGLKTSDRGTINANGSGRTTKQGVWAGGDIVTGAATVIKAMGAGKTAAKDIDEWLTNRGDWRTDLEDDGEK